MNWYKQFIFLAETRKDLAVSESHSCDVIRSRSLTGPDGQIDNLQILSVTSKRSCRRVLDNVNGHTGAR